MFRFNPLTGKLDLVGGSGAPEETNLKLRWALESIRAFDKEVSIQYTTQDCYKVDTVTLSSADFPDVQMQKSVYYLEATKRRLDRVEYSGPILEGLVLRKQYNYGPNLERLGFSYEVI